MTPAPGAPPRRLGLALLGLAALALVLRAAGLSAQPLTGDDAGVAETARNFVELGWPEPTMWNHPRLRDLLVHASMGLLGGGAWGTKLWSVLLGTLAAPAAALLAWSVGAGAAAAAIAGLLVAVDPLHLDFSRQAINDVYLSFFPVAAILALLRYRDRASPRWLALAGILVGLGAASKWSAVFPAGAAAAVVLAASLRSARSARERAAEVALFVACLGLLPIAVYVLTYWPWLGRGHDLAELARFHRAMALETSTHVGYAGTKLPGFPGEVVRAWRWFVQPVWYVDYIPPMPGRDAIPPGGLFVSGLANPLAWLATVPAAAWAAWRWLRARDAAAGWLLLLLVAAYLPFLAAPRPIWTNSALSVISFSAALVGWAAARLHERLRVPVRLWLAAAVVVAAILWAPAIGLPSRLGDAAVRVLVSPAALDPASHAGS